MSTSSKAAERLRHRTEQQTEKAARSDPDARPLSADDLSKLKRTARAKVIRRALSLTQEEFSKRYGIPIGTLRDWEQGRTKPDKSARAYLELIAHNPEGARQAGITH